MSVRILVTKEVQISCAHRLLLMPQKHPCYGVHGHNYRVIITVSSLVCDKLGFVVDFGELEAIVRSFDHRDLNELLGEQATTERLASAIWDEIEHLVLRPANENESPKNYVVLDSIVVWETDTCKVELRREAQC